MAKKSDPNKPKRARTPRQPNELSAAVKAFNQLKRKNAQRDKLFNKITDLDNEIVGLQGAFSDNMAAVNAVVEGKPVDAPEAA